MNVLQPVLAEETLLCSDGHSVYKAFAANVGVVHKVVNLSAGVHIVEQVFHIQNVNAYHRVVSRHGCDGSTVLRRSTCLTILAGIVG